MSLLLCPSSGHAASICRAPPASPVTVVWCHPRRGSSSETLGTASASGPQFPRLRNGDGDSAQLTGRRWVSVCLKMLGVPCPFYKYSDWGLLQKVMPGTADAHMYRREDVTGGEERGGEDGK